MVNKNISIKNEKIFFWGSKPLGLKCFKLLLYLALTKYPNLEIVGVCISNKDIKKDGVEKQDIRKIAELYKIPVFTEKDSIRLSGDLGVCIGYPHKIPKETIHRYKNGIINLHFAPLPYYRGSKTLVHAILNGEKRYGLTFHYIDESLDTGPIIAVKWYEISDDKTGQKMIEELEDLAFNFFKEYIYKMIEKKLPSVAQSLIVQQKKITPKFYIRSSLDSLYRISLNWPFEKIFRIVRALSLDGETLPYIEDNGKRIYLSLRP